MIKVNTTGLDALNPPDAADIVTPEKAGQPEGQQDDGTGEGAEDTGIEDAAIEGQTDETVPEKLADDAQEEVTVKPPAPKPVARDVAQARIDRMYARLMDERDAHTVTKTKNLEMARREMYEGDEKEDTGEKFTQKDAEKLWDMKDKQRQFLASEREVFLRHPQALNDDGSFNMEDLFMQQYIKIGRENLQLAFMVNGPRLAEAMVEKNTGLSYQKGKAEGAQDILKSKGAHTGSSTVAATGNQIVQLSDVKKKIAARMNMTEQEYIKYEKKIRGGDKTIR